jgi:hypothetical protein
MPQPLRKPARLQSDAILEKRPDHLAALALVSIHWAYLENVLSNLFSQLLTYAMAPQILMDKPFLLAPSGFILEEISNLAARIKLIEKLAQHDLSPDEFATWQKHAETVRSLGKSRATVVHGNWGYSVEPPKDLILVTRPKRIGYTVDDFKGIAGRIDREARSLAQFAGDCHQQRLKRLARKPPP